jgi:hypothetical protein
MDHILDIPTGDQRMAIKNITRLIIVALGLGWAFDYLFWGKVVGVSFFIFVAFCVMAGTWLAWRENLRPAKGSLWLLLPLAFFAGMTFVRREPITLFLDGAVTIGCLGLLAATFRSGQLANYSLADLIGAGGRLTAAGITGGGSVLAEAHRRGAERKAAVVAEGSELRPRRAVPVLRGILLALPVLLVLAALLASADPIFSQALGDFLRLFNLEKLTEYLFRLGYILVAAYILAGIFVYAFTRSQPRDLIGLEKPWLAPFLGWTEAVIVLGSVDGLFAAFVLFQVRYFFGGQANIHLQVYTYAEYARQGFGELVAVAVLSLMLLAALSVVTRRSAGVERRIFSSLNILLVGLVAVILVSAFQRLLLYEDAYGFTRIRSYVHVFMVWLGVLLASVAVLEALRRPRAFAMAALAAVVGFSATLNLLNVDALIVRQNVTRAVSGSELDGDYLAGLSDDAVPALVSAFSGASEGTLRDNLGKVLACRMQLQEMNRPDPSWQSFNLSTYWAAAALESVRNELGDEAPSTGGNGDTASRSGVIGRPCP